MSQTLEQLVGDFVVTQTEVTIQAVGATPIVGQRGDRWALLMAVSQTQSAVSVSINPITVVNNGIPVSPTTLPFGIHFQDWGALVNLPWYGIANAGPSNLSVIEVLYRPTGPTLGLEDVVKALGKLRRNQPSILDQLMALQQDLRRPPS